MGKVVLVSSGKGGTGKTMFTVNMGAMLAEKGCSVMLWIWIWDSETWIYTLAWRTELFITSWM